MRINPLLPRQFLMLSLLAAPLTLASAPTRAQPPADLAEEPYRVDSIGLTIHLPVGSVVEETQVGATTRGFRAKAQDNTWLLTFSTRNSRDQSLTPDVVAESLIEGLLSRRTRRDSRTGRAVGSGTEIVDRQRGLQVGGRPADRFYASVPRVDGGELRTGYTIVQSIPGEFIIFQLDTTAEEFSRAKAITEAAIETARFRDPKQLASDRQSGLEAGESFLAAMTAEDFRTVIPAEPALFRVYRPAPGGAPADAEEIAFQFVSIWEGHRGELDPRKPKKRWAAVDHEPGFLVSVHARALDSGRIIDSESIFFLREDRETEAWAIRMIVKKGEEEIGWTETGVREGDDIKVTVDVPSSSPVIKQWRKPELGYCSQVEAYLLPRLLVRAEATSPMRFYQYQSNGTDIALRSAHLQPAPDASEARVWTLISKRNEDAAEDTVTLDRDGAILRKRLGSGLMVTPTTREALDRLWRSKGLPPVG